MSFLSDFKAFAMRGNVIDMAVGIIIGAAFGTIVSSLVADVIMPPIGLLLGGMDFSDLVVILKKSTQTDPAVVLSYGKFIQHVISFLIIAFSVFVLIKAISRFEDKKTAAPAVPTKEQELLSEIRDLLKDKASK